MGAIHVVTAGKIQLAIGGYKRTNLSIAHLTKGRFMLTDSLARPLRDLRISVTDRCNFRCTYCMPAEGKYTFLPRKELLTFEEIATLARCFVEQGVRKLRLTGGEPLLRKDLPDLIAMLKAIEGIEDIAMTTNGFFLARYVRQLADVGLNRITVSIDSLQPETFIKTSGKNISPQVVLDAMDAAKEAGLKVKVNTVIQKGLNDGEILDLAQCFREKGHPLRFIEYMDVGNVNGWNMTHVVTAEQILRRIEAVYPCEPVDPNYRGEVARRYRYLDGKGEFGLISSVSQPFCGDCHRARISAEGALFTCLFASQGHDLKSLLRNQGTDAVRTKLQEIWSSRTDRYSQLRGEGKIVQDKVEMFKIGG